MSISPTGRATRAPCRRTFQTVPLAHRASRPWTPEVGLDSGEVARTRRAAAGSRRMALGRPAMEGWRTLCLTGVPCRPILTRRAIDKRHLSGLSFSGASVIRSFRHRGLKRLYRTGDGRGIRPDLLGTVQNILSVLDVAASPEALSLPRYRLHALKGDRRGAWAVTVKANWRIVFRFLDGDVYDVELIDYH